jgi:hypothetical protein
MCASKNKQISLEPQEVMMKHLNFYEMSQIQGGAKPPQQELDSAKAALSTTENSNDETCAKPPQQEIDS